LEIEASASASQQASKPQQITAATIAASKTNQTEKTTRPTYLGAITASNKA